jgi:hypothetical protein
MKMVVVVDVWIETLGTAKYVNDIYDANFGKSFETAVYRIEGNIGKIFLDQLINVVGSGMSLQAFEFLKNNHTLRGYF